MKTRFTKKLKIFDVCITAFALMASVGIMLYGIFYYDFRDTWPELVLNAFYIACVVMIWMYFFGYRITTKQFNYLSSACVCVTVLLRDILFPPPMPTYTLHVISLTLSVWLVMLLTYFYARKEFRSYTKGNLWFIFVCDLVLALVYNYANTLEPEDDITDYVLTEMWIRPTITYALVACYVADDKAPE